ncbi:hypothetical protein ACFSVJ_27560 [Prauserella oleivorans]
MSQDCGAAGYEYARLPALVPLPLANVEAHTHLARVEEASRMWRTVTTRLRELSDALRNDLEHLRPQWTDGTGAEFVRQVVVRKAAIDDVLTRIAEHQPCRALDDLARQLLLCRETVTHTAQRGTEASGQEAGLHLAELDRYFRAAAAASSVPRAIPPAPRRWTPVHTAAVRPAPPRPPRSPLPRGRVLCRRWIRLGAPGRHCRPAVSRSRVSSPFHPAARSGAAPRRGSGSRGASPGPAGLPGDSSSLSGGAEGSRIEGSEFTPRSSGSVPDTGTPGPPPRIDQAANPVPISAPPSTSEAPQPPQAAGGTEPKAHAGPGRMVPPMMMPGALRPGGGGRSAPGKSLEAAERRPRNAQAVPGVPARLQGRSALAATTGRGYRPIAMSAARNATPEPQVLDHEVWQVADPAVASPLTPEAAEPEQPRRLRRLRL